MFAITAKYLSRGPLIIVGKQVLYQLSYARKFWKTLTNEAWLSSPIAS